MNKSLLLLCLGLVTPLIAWSQEDASRIEERFEVPPPAKSSQQPLFIPLQEQLPPEHAQQIRFKFREVVFEGNTAFSNADLQSLSSKMIGQNISIYDLYRLRDAITAEYGNAGYGLAKAIIPEQNIQQADGIVHIQILEGYIDKVIIEGNTNGEQQAFLNYISDKIKAERPLNVKTLERYLLLANERFAIKVTSTLTQSKENSAGTTQILKVESAPSINGGVSIDNHGTQAVGPNQVSGNISAGGLFGLAEQTSLSYFTSGQAKELHYLTISQTGIVNAEGTSLSLIVNNIKSAPGTPALLLLNQRSTSNSWSLKLASPLIRTRQKNLTTHLTFEHKDTNSQTLGAIISEDKTRSLRTGLSYDKADSFDGINQVLIEFSAGLKSMGATSQNSIHKSRADGKVDYKKITWNLSRNQELGHFDELLSKFSVNFAVMGQYAKSGLLSAEECGIGGQQFGRAYNPSEIIGDRCMAASMEFRFAPAFDVFKYTQFYSFYDGGTTINENLLGVSDQLRKSLSSTGLGLRYGIGNHLTGTIEATKPLTRIVANEGNKQPRLFASINVRF